MSSFSQSLNYNKLTAEQKEVMLTEEQLNKINWTRIEFKSLTEWSHNMNLKIDHAETVMKSSTVLQFTFKRRSRSSEHENHSFSTKISDVRRSRSSEHENYSFTTEISDVNMHLSSLKSTSRSVLIIHQSSRLFTSVSLKSSCIQLVVSSISSTSAFLKMMK